MCIKHFIDAITGWVRAGTDICYYRNSYHYAHQRNLNKCYLTVTFNIEFPHTNDVCYLAYHFPYTYSMMMVRIMVISCEKVGLESRDHESCEEPDTLEKQ